MSELGYQSANAIVGQIVKQLREEEESIIRPTPPGYGPPPEYKTPTGYETPPSYKVPPVYTLLEQPPPPPTYDLPVQPVPLSQATAVIPANLNTAELQAMMQSIKLMHGSMHQSYYQGSGRGRGCAQGRGQGRYGGRGSVDQHMVGVNYCHTHSNCALLGSACRTPGPTHNNKATFANIMGESKLRCYWINP